MKQHKQQTSSRENKTPPIGAPKATLTPAAAAADKICGVPLLPSFLYLSCPFWRIILIISFIINMRKNNNGCELYVNLVCDIVLCIIM